MTFLGFQIFYGNRVFPSMKFTFRNEKQVFWVKLVISSLENRNTCVSRVALKKSPSSRIGQPNEKQSDDLDNSGRDDKYQRNQEM